MPAYTLLDPDWVTNNPLMRSLEAASSHQEETVPSQQEAEALDKAEILPQEEENKPVQAQLTLEQQGDKYEQKDSVAAQVVNQMSAEQVTVQRYSEGGIDEFLTEGKLSENELYFVPEGGQFIYAQHIPLTCHETGASDYVSYNGKTYKKCLPRIQFYQDCLHTAEEIINQVYLEPHKGTYSRESITNRVFGQNDEKNKEIAIQSLTTAQATGAAINDTANPSVGQAYVIVNLDFPRWKKKADYPYHAAAVVATDGADRVTIEVFAGSTDAASRSIDGNFAMYTVGGSGLTFHDAWNYLFKNAITITIKPK